jgi:hypothetical protein
LLAAAWLGPAQGWAQEKSISGLRIAQDASGVAVGEIPSPQGEKYFRLAEGTDSFLVAFDYDGGAPTEVQVRVMGAMGTVLQQKDATYDAPGTYVVEIDNNGRPFEVNEYVVNLYVGKDRYLADSLQLAIGEASIAPSVADRTAQAAVAGAGEPTVAAVDAGAVVNAAAPVADVPGGPSPTVLALVGLGALALLAVVLWAGWSAMGRS